jgi:protein PhnA
MNGGHPELFNLAVVRIFFFICVLITASGPDYFLQWSQVPSQFWTPRGILRLFSEPLRAEFIVYAFHTWRWLTLACLFGVFFRWTAPIWWVLRLIVITNGHSYGYQGHVYMPLVLASLPLCFSRASDAFSFDSWKKPIAVAVDLQAYVLPVRTIQIALVLAYFAAGVSKLRFGGLEWITGDTLRNYLIRSSLIFSDSNQRPECSHEWSPAEMAAEAAKAAESLIVRDAHGNVLQDGDTVTVIKDLKIKGSSSSVKVGTKVKNIRLSDAGDGHDISCKIDGFGAMNLKSEYVKKV